jgi:hypothetical protein
MPRKSLLHSFRSFTSRERLPFKDFPSFTVPVASCSVLGDPTPESAKGQWQKNCDILRGRSCPDTSISNKLMRRQLIMFKGSKRCATALRCLGYGQEDYNKDRDGLWSL